MIQFLNIVPFSFKSNGHFFLCFSALASVCGKCENVTEQHLSVYLIFLRRFLIANKLFFFFFLKEKWTFSELVLWFLCLPAGPLASSSSPLRIACRGAHSCISLPRPLIVSLWHHWITRSGTSLVVISVMIIIIVPALKPLAVRHVSLADWNRLKKFGVTGLRCWRERRYIFVENIVSSCYYGYIKIYIFWMKKDIYWRFYTSRFTHKDVISPYELLLHLNNRGRQGLEHVRMSKKKVCRRRVQVWNHLKQISGWLRESHRQMVREGTTITTASRNGEIRIIQGVSFSDSQLSTA